jgi:deoxyribonuclease-4
MKLKFAENLRKMRRENGFTQEQLAEKVGVSFQTVSRWETGVVYPDIETLPILAEIFETRVDELIGCTKNDKDKILEKRWEEYEKLTDAEEQYAFLKEMKRNFPKEYLIPYTMMQIMHYDKIHVDELCSVFEDFSALCTDKFYIDIAQNMYISLEEENAVKSYNYILQSAEKVKLMGGKRVVFHPASQGKMSREQAVDLTAKRLEILRDKIYEKGLDNLIYCPETMGKLGQIGTIEEVVRFCKIDKIYTPAVDFGHVNAREWGSLKTEKDYLDRLNYMIDELGYERMKNFHIHFSKIEYSAKGEVRHLTFEDDHYGPDFYPLSLALKKLKLEPFIICESAGTQDIDAVKMQNTYRDN